MSVRRCLLLCTVVVAACGDDGSGTVTPDTTVDSSISTDSSDATSEGDSGLSDTSPPDVALPDVSPDVSGDVPDVLFPDTDEPTDSIVVSDTAEPHDTIVGDTSGDTADTSQPDVVEPPWCATAEGLGCECLFGSDCASDLCLSREGLCSQGCEDDDDCPAVGFHCGLVPDGFDVVRACVLDDEDRCDLCDGDDDCADGYVCATVGDRKACVYECDFDGECLSGTSCDQVGASAFDTACVPLEGQCGCAPGAVEQCDGEDDDCDGETDEGFDLTTIERCGACDNRCDTTHQTPTCVEGGCVRGTCEQGWDDCDGRADTGCEVELATRCGSCGGSKNACGGCAVLGHAPGDACGTCGKYACDGTEGLKCDEPASCEPSRTITNTVTLSGDQSYNELVIGNGGTLKVGGFDGSEGSGGSGSAGAGTLVIEAVSIRVSAGGVIDASGAGGAGIGFGIDADGSLPNDAGPGGGYGGKGGDGPRGILKGGEPFGSADGDDISQGSNGADTRCRNTCAPCAPNDTITGGRGGGLVILKAQTIVIDGKVLADGLDGGAGGLVELGAGGGSGGGVWLEGDSVTIAGTVSANGGKGGVGTQHAFGNGQMCIGFGGSGGSGGRVKVVARAYQATGTVRALGGAGAFGPMYVGRPGAPGTVHTPAPACDATHVDCDGQASNGCETNLTSAVCGGCGPYPGTVGASCGTCGSGTWQCDGAGVMSCHGDAGLGGLNACGGCAALPQAVGSACAGGCGQWECASNDTVACSSDGPNECGGCEALPGAVGGACGTCSQGTYACDGTGMVCEDADKCETYLTVDAQSLDVSGPVSVDHVVVKNGGVLHVRPFDGTVGDGTTGTSGYGNLVVNAKTIEVDATSSIDASGAGGAGTAPGQTMSASLENDAAGGGGYGGNGGNGAMNILKGGLAFGTAAGPDLSQGSNGGGTRCRNTTAPCKNTPEDERVAGGKGGGMIDLTASERIDIAGKILADGLPGQDGGNVELAGGGGSGGGIRLSAPIVALAATAILSANGGKGGTGIQHGTSVGFGGGGGGGGRIKIVAQLYAPISPTLRANAGAGGAAPSTYQGKAGANGSVDVPPTP